MGVQAFPAGTEMRWDGEPSLDGCEGDGWLKADL